MLYLFGGGRGVLVPPVWGMLDEVGPPVGGAVTVAGVPCGANVVVGSIGGEI